MKILGLDFETTGIDTQKDRVIEVGYVQWDTARKVPIQIGDFLIKHEAHENVVVSPLITKITGIEARDVEENGIPLAMAFEPLVCAINASEFIVAHNGNRFDKPLFEAELKRLGWTDRVKPLPWIDTLLDVPYPTEYAFRNLGVLAEKHNLKNAYAHRAAFDVLTMLQVLDLYDFHSVIERSKLPNALVQAKVSFDKKDLAKARGFYWDGPTKRWLKWVKELTIDEEAKLGGFEIVKVEESRS